MNFGRILNIFILLFIIANILLYGLYDHKKKVDYSLSTERETQLIEILEENNISIYTLLPMFYPRSKLKVELIDINSETYPKQFFDGGYTLKPLEQRYTKGDEDLVIYSKAKEIMIKYEKKANVPMENFDKASVEKIGKKLVDRLTLNKNNMIMTSSRPDDNLTEYVLVYNDKAKDEILFSSFVELTINKNGDVTGKSKRYKSIEFSGVNTKLIPVDEVLYKFMYNIEGKENNEVIKIIGIDIGYYVDEEVNENLAEPCYRISLGDGEVHYINAYNNEEISYTESNQEE